MTDYKQRVLFKRKGNRMDDRIGNIKSQIEHLRAGLDTFQGDSDTSLKQAIANTEKVLHQLEKAVNNQENNK